MAMGKIFPGKNLLRFLLFLFILGRVLDKTRIEEVYLVLSPEHIFTVTGFAIEICQFGVIVLQFRVIVDEIVLFRHFMVIHSMALRV